MCVKIPKLIYVWAKIVARHITIVPIFILITITIEFRTTSWQSYSSRKQGIMMVLHRYFGLQYQDSKGYIAWLKLDKKVTEMSGPQQIIIFLYRGQKFKPNLLCR